MTVEKDRNVSGGLSRRRFLGLGGASAALAAMGTVSGPLGVLGANTAMGKPMKKVVGYGELFDRGDLFLPSGFRYEIISRAGEEMTDGNPTPTYFDGMAAYRGERGTTVLIRNHENRLSTGRIGETEVVVPEEMRYDESELYNAGNTKLVLSPKGRVIEEFAVLGGTSTNCAGGPMPWGSWITCEEVFQVDTGSEPHGYNFEIDFRAEGPVQAVPIRGAGRFSHEAVAWMDGVLYETEDRTDNACFYRYVPDQRIRRSGDLARSAGSLQALAIKGQPNRNMDKGTPVGRPFDVEWVDIADPEPTDDTVRVQGVENGAALFDREEGAWTGKNGRVYFDCTSGGDADSGQVWEFDPRRQKLTLIFESPGAEVLEGPDNIVVAPKTGDIFLCEDANDPQYIRGVTQDGRIFDFAQSITNGSEFCGACFSPDGGTLYVNQQGGNVGSGEEGVTYAITGPFDRRRGVPLRPGQGN